jgi:hypothetical protein
LQVLGADFTGKNWYAPEKPSLTAEVSHKMAVTVKESGYIFGKSDIDERLEIC